MAIDAMDVDTSPRANDVERKRKHKNKDASPSKKRKHEVNGDGKTSKSKKDKTTKTTSTPATSVENAESPFSLATATLYLPLSPISISPTHALASLLAEHLSPLLLTYYPPLKGVVMAYSNASISSHPPSSSTRQSSDPNPQPLTLAKTADEYGVLYVYLTATFLVFRPRRGQTLEGWVNVQSEGFLGAVVFNLFSVGVERKRLPTNWRWVPPGEEDEDGTSSAAKDTTTDDESGGQHAPPGFDPIKEQFQPAALAADELDIDGEDEDESATGHFQSVSGHRVRGNVRFRVVDIDVIPGSERDRGFLSIEGTMLSVEEEEKLMQAERQGQSLPPSFLTSPAKKTARVIPVSSEPPASSVQDVSVVEIEPEQATEKEKKEKKDKKDKEKKEKKEKKKSKKDKKEK